ncbi:MAG: RHS repeat-associated core domain-containing protein [Pseudomonadota bacterium]
MMQAEQTLADGEHLWTATVRNGLGEVARLQGRYTVDTRPPQIVDLSPPTGSRFNQPVITITGRADEPGAVVHLENPAQLQAQGGNPQTEQFNWALTLQPGDNSVTLTAVDLAGNAFTLKPVYGYDPFGTVQWVLRAPKRGTYRLSVNWIGQAGPTAQVAYRIQHAGGETVATAAPGSQNQSLALGEYRFEANVDYLLKLTSQNTVGEFTVADAAQLDQVDGEEVAYAIHADQLGSPRVVTDANRQIVWRWDNDEPFGANAANENPSNLGAFVMNLRFPGQYHDAETNLHYNYYRDYDPGTGRYIQSDPIGLEGGINLYAYVGGNPLTQVDLFGLANGPAIGWMHCKPPLKSSHA